MKKLIITNFFFLSFISSVLCQSWEETFKKEIEYYTQGDLKNAIEYGEQAVKLAEKEFGKDNNNYAKSLNTLGVFYFNTGNYNKAEKLYIEALNIRKKILGESHTDYLKTLDNIAVLYHKTGDYSNAEKLYLETLKIKKEIFGENADYALSLNNLAVLYKDKGDYNSAERLNIQACKIYKETLGEKAPNYAATLNNLAELYKILGNYEKSESIYKVSMKIRKDTFGEKHYLYAGSLCNLADLYYIIGDYKNAETYFIEACKIFKDVDEKNPDYTESLNNLAGLYKEIGQYKDAERLYTESLKIKKEIYGEKHDSYALTLFNFAELYRVTGDYKSAESYYVSSEKICKEVLGEKHPDYALVLFGYAKLFFETGNYVKARQLFLELIKNLTTQIQTNFSFMNENEKFKFLNTINPNFDAFYSFALNDYKNNPSIAADVMNLDIAIKGVILSSTSKVKQKVNELIMVYDKLSSIRKTLAYAYSLSAVEQENKGINISTLEEEANQLEKELTQKSEYYSEEKRIIEWKDIQKEIKQNEALVEFIEFKYFNKRWTDTTYYCALIHRNDYSYPKLIKLFSLEQVKDILSNNVESKNSYIKNPEVSSELYKFIWKPLEQNLKGVTTVLISPCGILNKISFSALQTPEGELLIDKFKLKYIGNVKDVAGKKWSITSVIPQEKFAAVFGGAEYDLDSNEIVANKIKFKSEEYTKTFFAINEKDKTEKEYKKGSWVYLRGTLSECETINDLMVRDRINVQKFTGKDACEDAFKSLNSKNSPTILHISTHGFFFPEPQKNYGMEMTGSELFKRSDNPLLRSGLVLAGANRVWSGSEPIEGVEDGILTAYEVSNMDLQNTELVVLSACETGLGDIKGGEGVYGLQRAFKIAGAKTIIMSLWKVPDKETVELMELFYTNWLERKMTKEEAFNEAQKEMRNKYPPYYWAAFVMVE